MRKRFARKSKQQKNKCIHNAECSICQEICTQAKRQQQEETDYYHCFECLKTYHHQCAYRELDDSYNTVGPCCYHQRCQYCKKNIKNQEQFFSCSICLRKTHNSCYCQLTGKEISLNEQQRQGLVFGEHSYVCMNCLHRYGFVKIKKIMKVKFGEYFKISKRYVALVQIKHESPIHYGWFIDKELTKTLAVQSERQASQQFFKPVSAKFFNRKAAIEAILDWKGTLAHNSTDAFKMIRDEERNNQLKYRNENNFKFLVKWNFSSYNTSTWEDQVTVKLISRLKLEQYMHRKQFIKYGHYHIYNYINKAQKQQILARAFEYEPSAKMNRVRDEYTAEIIKNDEPNAKIPMLCNFLNISYIALNFKRKTIVVTDSIKQWQTNLINLCNYLNYVVYTGSIKSIELIEELQFKNPTFDVLLVSYRYFLERKTQIKAAIGEVYMVIMDDYNASYKEFIIQEFQQKAQKFIVLINKQEEKPTKQQVSSVKSKAPKFIDENRSNNQDDFARKVISAFPTRKIIVHDIYWTKHQILNCFETVQKNLVRTCSTSEHHRQAFLNYILQFGIQPTKLREIYDQIYKSPKMLQFIKGFSFEDFIKYTKRFMSILSHSKDFKLDAETQKFYLFEVKPELVIQKVSFLLSCNISKECQETNSDEVLEIAQQMNDKSILKIESEK